MIQLHDYGARATLRGGPVLDDDPRRGLVSAVNNNQSQMALRYALQVIADLDEKVDLLMKEREDMQRSVAEVNKQAMAKPPVAEVKRKSPSPKKEDDEGVDS